MKDFSSCSQAILGNETAGMKMESKVSWDIYEFSRWNTDFLREFKLDSTGDVEKKCQKTIKTRHTSTCFNTVQQNSIQIVPNNIQKETKDNSPRVSKRALKKKDCKARSKGQISTIFDGLCHKGEGRS